MPAPPIPADERPAPSLWRNLSFQLLWTSTFAAGFGDRMIQMAAWAMLGISLAGAQASSIQAGVAFFFFAPYILLSAVGGWLADTLPRKVILFSCDEVRALILLTALLVAPAGGVAAIPPDHHWKVYAVVFAVGCMAAIFSPTRAATVPQVVPVRHLQAANAIVMGLAVIGSLIGLVIGGPIITRSVRAGLAVGAATFAVTGVFFLLMRLQRHSRAALGPRKGEAARMFEAAAYIWRHRPLRELVALNVLFWAAANILVAAITALCKNRYGLEPERVVAAAGGMLAAVGGGMLLSSLGVAWMNTRRESPWMMMLWLGMAGVTILTLALVRSYPLAMALAFLTGFFGNAAMIVTTTLIQSIAADYIRGRVFGVREVFNTSSAVVVNFAIWRTPDADNAMVPALYVTAAVLLAVALRGAWTQMARGPMPTAAANVFWRIDRGYVFVWHRLRLVGRHRVPAAGPVVLAANHTTGIDPFLMQAGCTRMVRWVMLTSYRFRVLGPLWRSIQPIALDQETSDLSQLREIARALKDGEIVGLFPEGELQREHRRLQPFQPGIAMLAVRAKARIVPVWIAGTPRARRMIWHFLRPSRSTVVYGEAYEPDENKSYEEITADLRARMLALAADRHAACPACGGDLRGDPGATSCPECGEGVVPLPTSPVTPR